ncbi:MAG: UDP-N-acetylglucosamine 2-epimerase (non-hydrolyzing) [Candidatus Methanofastidiosum sp.]|nr:UDP-N-acetylglucosamine 2-epimerase (non-hydrolyzing) [Methanofastidiosum sp.]NYT14237.1 UDP-N-acetylglucosamine 2-epimerase (non-hydrolyzing) [Candidatus Methanofastidiosa archaeon]
MKILSIVGARPNFMKIKPIYEELKKRNIDQVLVHTGQHYDENMNRVFFEDLQLPKPDVFLGIGSGTHGVQTGAMMSRIEEVLAQEKPDLTIVVGDVNSTLAGAISSIKMQIPVAHVEAGYRSFDMIMPEEINRILVDRISQFLFAPTEDAVNNLLSEGSDKNRIFFVGNVMVETLLSHLQKSKKSNILKGFSLDSQNYGLMTIHRAENTADPVKLVELFDSLNKIETKIIVPLHPRTKKVLEDIGHLKKLGDNIEIIEPLGYLDFLCLMSNSKFIMTDSGGIQEEALMLDVPCITLRENTERVVTLKNDANILVGTDPVRLSNAIEDISKRKKKYPKPPLWDDKVSKRIVQAILDHPELFFL